MNKIKTKFCPVCRKKFPYAIKNISHRGIKTRKTIRNKRDATCSKPCSKIYQDCIRVYRNKLKMENK